MTQAADVVVIGAGIVGAASTWRLAQRGLKVWCVEQASPASGSTGRSVAGVRSQFTGESNILLARESIAEYAGMPDSGYRPDGYLMLVPDSDWAGHRAGVARQRELGVPTELLTPAQAQQHVAFDPHGVAGCSFCATDGRVDAHGLTLAYVRQARDAGARFLLDTPVTAIERVDGMWQLETPAGPVRAPLLVNAAGAWSGEVAALAGLEVPVQPARRMVFATGPLALPRPVPMVFDLQHGVYLRSEGERLIFGRADPADTGWKGGLNWEWLEPTLTLALARFPWLEAATLDRRASWWGYYEVTPDHQPIVGWLPGAPGWLNACGFSGHGVMQAAAIGRVVAQLAVGEPPLIDLTPFRAERFGERRPTARDLQV